MGLISSFGNFLDRFFEPKASISSLVQIEKDTRCISDRIKVIENRFSSTETFYKKFLEQSENDFLKLRDELTAIKALYKIGGTKPESHLTQKFDGSQPWKR